MRARTSQTQLHHLSSPKTSARSALSFFFVPSTTMVGALLLLVVAFALKLFSAVSFLSAKYHAAQL